MKSSELPLVCHVKSFRLRKGWSQTQLAELVGVKRQAIYDIESGKYAPNTALALRLAKHLGCRVEDLFTEEETDAELPVVVVGEGPPRPRAAMARLRDRTVAYPLGGQWSLNTGFGAADGLVLPNAGTARLLASPEALDKTLLLLGCDPAFPILAAHAERLSPSLRVRCIFASSHKAIRGLGAGQAHIAGTHLHNEGKDEANVKLARTMLTGSEALVVGFSEIEEGMLVARGNPLGIRGVADLARPGVRLINREPGAALRNLLDFQLTKLGVPAEAIGGYGATVSDHMQGAQKVLHGLADAALGFRAMAEACGLDFVPIEFVRCDLVAPKDLLDHPAMTVLLDALQTRRLREELRSLPGYEASGTGSVIAEI